ncbi:MAG: hypothetical protein HY659_03825 [Rhizobiales bacterium]|nr:hypothetical protein [Hyphomicrobiales bacterium]
MKEKPVEQMERPELIGMVHALQRQIAEFYSPERTRIYTLGRLEMIAREGFAPDGEPAEFEHAPIWKRLLPRR